MSCGVSVRMRSQCLSMRQHERRRPGEAALDQHDLELRKALEHALEHQARQRVLHAARRSRSAPACNRSASPTPVEGWPPLKPCTCSAIGTIGALRRLVDRPVAPVPERIARARRDQDLHEGRIVRARARSRSPRRPRPPAAPRCRRAAAAPACTQASSCQSLTAARQRGGEFEIALLHAAAAQLHQHAVLDPVGIEMLPAHQLEIGAGRALLAERRRPACRRRHHARIGAAGPTGPGADARRRWSCARASAPAGTGCRSAGVR